MKKRNKRAFFVCNDCDQPCHLIVEHDKHVKIDEKDLFCVEDETFLEGGGFKRQSEFALKDMLKGDQ